MVDTRSGELLSAFIGIAMACAVMMHPESMMAATLGKADVLPEWAIISLLCSMFSVASVYIDSLKMQAMSRFLSGCLWGSLVLVYGAVGQPYVIFWTSLVLFLFDIIVVTTKGRQAWIPKNHSSTQA